MSGIFGFASMIIFIIGNENGKVISMFNLRVIFSQRMQIGTIFMIICDEIKFKVNQTHSWLTYFFIISTPILRRKPVHISVLIKVPMIQITKLKIGVIGSILVHSQHENVMEVFPTICPV